MIYAKEEARLKIQKLVEDFRAQEAMLEAAPEAQIEQNFIRPLFRYLNWNTENEGLSPAHYEFKVQATNRKGLRPDYILNLEGRDVLVMDAKQVKYSMKDPRWLYQVYSYAYSTQNSKPSKKIDFAILTDFQEFIVLDCTLFAAKPEAVNNFRVIDWKYGDYVEKFDELWELFERNHVIENSRPPVIASRSLAKQSPTDEQGIASAEEHRLAVTKRGLWSRYLSPGKVKSNRVPPDKAFLAEMDDEKNGWRVLLAKDMKKRNPGADGELITAAVQLLIDRLIFIKALSDREVDRDYLSEIKARVEEAGLGDAQREAGWFQACQTIFEELNNFYNGSIFEPRPELEHVSVSNKAVQEVIHDLQPENSPYNFAVLPVEILGTIYERFLGRVVRTTEKQVKIEEKPEVRKAGGVYYTPQYIVDYIVKNTLGKLLEDCKTPADAAKLKVLDPACGSGSFLLGANDHLIQWHKDYFARAGKEKRDRESFYRDESGQIRLTAKLKREILKNNLFGVDIDPQAVEVTRFSLSLKALEDLREGELTEERSLFHQTVLPDLSGNIKCGNSLIGTDYFGLVAPTLGELKAVKPFNWKNEFSEILKGGGFDVVIGNPPYVFGGNYGIEQNDKAYFKTHYFSGTGKVNLFTLLIEKSVQILRQKGLVSFIVPNTLLRVTSYSRIREFIVKNTAIKHIADLGTGVFEGATTSSIVFSLEKETNSSENQVEIKIGIEGRPKVMPQKEFARSGYIFNINTSGKESDLLQRLKDKTIGLGELCDELIFGVVITKNKDEVVSDKPGRGYKPFLEGRDIERYFIRPTQKYLLYEPKKLHRARTPEIFEAPEKILIQRITGGNRPLNATYDDQQYYNKESINNIIVKQDISYSTKYILGIVNSALINWYYKTQFTNASILTVNLSKEYLSQIPIRAIDFTNPAEKSQHEKMVGLVSQMLELHKSKAAAKTQTEIELYERQIQSVDGEIDRLVYELYGLSEEEVKVVEGR